MSSTLTLMLTTWSGLAVCVAWCFASAKRNAPITLNDAEVMWMIHRKNTSCTGHKWQPITRREGKIIGFQCECGYKYRQKRPLVSRMPRHK